MCGIYGQNRTEEYDSPLEPISGKESDNCLAIVKQFLVLYRNSQQ